MKQDVGSVVVEAVKVELFSYIGLAVKYITIVLLFVLLTLNIYVSQTIHPLYFQFIKEDLKSAITLTKKVRSLPEGRSIRVMQTAIYGDELNGVLVADETKTETDIAKYEQALVQNPQARDVLYNLYILYKHKLDPKADDYLQRLQAIDPAIQK